MLFDSGSKDSKASANDEKTSVRMYSTPNDLCQSSNSESSCGIGAWIKPKSPVTGCHFSKSDDMRRLAVKPLLRAHQILFSVRCSHRNGKVLSRQPQRLCVAAGTSRRLAALPHFPESEVGRTRRGHRETGAHDPTPKSSGLDGGWRVVRGVSCPLTDPRRFDILQWGSCDLRHRRPDSGLLMLTIGEPISRGCQMRLCEFIAHAMKERVGRIGIVLLAGAGLVLATSVSVFAAGDQEDCAATGNLDQSIVACARVVADDAETAANRAVAYKNRGNAYYNKKDYDGAIADYNEAIRLDPSQALTYHVLAYVNRARLYFDKEDYDRAIADYSEAIKLDPYVGKQDLDRGFAD